MNLFKIIQTFFKKQPRYVIGYMCKTDWDFELGNALDGNKIYPSQGSLLANRSCIAECGMVEVEVRLRKVIQKEDFSIKPDKTYLQSYIDENGQRRREEMSGADLLKRLKRS